MALWFKLNVNAEEIGTIEIRRREHLDLTDKAAIADAVSTYDVFRDNQPIGSLMHRYGDEAWRLVADAADMIAETDGHAVLHHGCAEYMADQVRSLHVLDIVEVIAAAMRSEGDEPRTNGDMVKRLIDLIADQIELLPHHLKAGGPIRCQDPSCPDFGDPDFGEGTCPAEHAEPPAVSCARLTEETPTP